MNTAVPVQENYSQGASVTKSMSFIAPRSQGLHGDLADDGPQIAASARGPAPPPGAPQFSPPLVATSVENIPLGNQAAPRPDGTAEGVKRKLSLDALAPRSPGYAAPTSASVPREGYAQEPGLLNPLGAPRSGAPIDPLALQSVNAPLPPGPPLYANGSAPVTRSPAKPPLAPSPQKPAQARQPASRPQLPIQAFYQPAAHPPPAGQEPQVLQIPSAPNSQPNSQPASRGGPAGPSAPLYRAPGPNGAWQPHRTSGAPHHTAAPPDTTTRHAAPPGPYRGPPTGAPHFFSPPRYPTHGPQYGPPRTQSGPPGPPFSQAPPPNFYQPPPGAYYPNGHMRPPPPAYRGPPHQPHPGAQAFQGPPRFGGPPQYGGPMQAFGAGGPPLYPQLGYHPHSEDPHGYSDPLAHLTSEPVQVQSATATPRGHRGGMQGAPADFRPQSDPDVYGAMRTEQYSDDLGMGPKQNADDSAYGGDLEYRDGTGSGGVSRSSSINSKTSDHSYSPGLHTAPPPATHSGGHPAGMKASTSAPILPSCNSRVPRKFSSNSGSSNSSSNGSGNGYATMVPGAMQDRGGEVSSTDQVPLEAEDDYEEMAGQGEGDAGRSNGHDAGTLRSLSTKGAKRWILSPRSSDKDPTAGPTATDVEVRVENETFDDGEECTVVQIHSPDRESLLVEVLDELNAHHFNLLSVQTAKREAKMLTVSVEIVDEKQNALSTKDRESLSAHLHCMLFVRAARGESLQGQVAGQRLLNQQALRSTKERWHIDADSIEISKSSVLGEGRFGRVFLGRWAGVNVAVKELKPQTIGAEVNSLSGNQSSSHAVNWFKLELAVLASLAHPNVVQFFGVVADSKPMLLVEEYLAGGNMRELFIKCFHRGQAIPLLEALELAIQVAQGMTYLHERKPVAIIHRDLKPENILLDGTGRLKITDFGLCKPLMGHEAHIDDARKHGAGDLTAEERNNLALGTPVFMAPEVFERKTYGRGVDVWSFSMILFELLQGQPPWKTHQGQPWAKIMELLVKGWRPQWEKPVDPAMQELVEMCWEGTPHNRPNFRQICETIEPHIDMLRMKVEDKPKADDGAATVVEDNAEGQGALDDEEKEVDGVSLLPSVASGLKFVLLVIWLPFLHGLSVAPIMFFALHMWSEGMPGAQIGAIVCLVQMARAAPPTLAPIWGSRIAFVVPLVVSILAYVLAAGTHGDNWFEDATAPALLYPPPPPPVPLPPNPPPMHPPPVPVILTDTDSDSDSDFAKYLAKHGDHTAPPNGGVLMSNAPAHPPHVHDEHDTDHHDHEGFYNTASHTVGMWLLLLVGAGDVISCMQIWVASLLPEQTQRVTSLLRVHSKIAAAGATLGLIISGTVYYRFDFQGLCWLAAVQQICLLLCGLLHLWVTGDAGVTRWKGLRETGEGQTLPAMPSVMHLHASLPNYDYKSADPSKGKEDDLVRKKLVEMFQMDSMAEAIGAKADQGVATSMSGSAPRFDDDAFDVESFAPTEMEDRRNKPITVQDILEYSGLYRSVLRCVHVVLTFSLSMAIVCTSMYVFSVHSEHVMECALVTGLLLAGCEIVYRLVSHFTSKVLTGLSKVGTGVYHTFSKKAAAEVEAAGAAQPVVTETLPWAVHRHQGQLAAAFLVAALASIPPMAPFLGIELPVVGKSPSLVAVVLSCGLLLISSHLGLATMERVSRRAQTDYLSRYWSRNGMVNIGAFTVGCFLGPVLFDIDPGMPFLLITCTGLLAALLLAAAMLLQRATMRKSVIDAWRGEYVPGANGMDSSGMSMMSSSVMMDSSGAYGGYGPQSNGMDSGFEVRETMRRGPRSLSPTIEEPDEELESPKPPKRTLKSRFSLR